MLQCCSVLQCVAMKLVFPSAHPLHPISCAFVVQRVAVYCSVLQCVPICCDILQWLQCVAVRCSALPCVAVCMSSRDRTPVTLHQLCVCIAMWCGVLRCAAVCCSALQCVAERCNDFNPLLRTPVTPHQQCVWCTRACVSESVDSFVWRGMDKEMDCSKYICNSPVSIYRIPHTHRCTYIHVDTHA